MSKLILVCALLSLLSPSISVPLILPQNLSEEFISPDAFALKYANYGNYFITSSVDASDVNYLAVFKIDSQGVLTNVTRVDVDQSYDYLSFFTNGKWYGSGFSLGITMFQLDANDQAVENRLFEKSGGLRPVWMLSDDTIVAYNQLSTGFYVYKYESGSDDWMEIQFIPFAMPFGSPRAAVTDNTLVAIDTTAKMYTYSRAANGTFVLVDLFSVDAKYFPDSNFNLFYNGGDTIIVTTTYLGDMEPYRGLYMFYTRKNETSRAVTFFYQSHLEFIGDININYVVVTALDGDNILIGAPLHGALERKKRNVQEEPNFGKVAWVQRANSINNSSEPWVHIADIDSKAGNYFGSAVMTIGNHVGITQCDSNVGADYGCKFWVVPQCVVRPIGVTCDTKEFDSCDIDLTTNYFTVADPLCENSVTVTDMAYTDYTFTATYTLQRPFVASETCNASLVCPRPPVTSTVPVAAPKGGVSTGSALVNWNWIGASLMSTAVVVIFL